ncbi:MAG: photosynthetic complex putative assembly protein PuhB, partial [Pseudomonadota bacterium]
MQNDDIEEEPVLGLPERPPEGERILWQGKPDWWALARDAMMVRGVAVWFVVLAAWRGIVAGPDAAILISIMGVVACLLLMAVAWAQAKATVYTLTTKRVAMRGAPKQRPAFVVHEVGAAEGRSPEAA